MASLNTVPEDLNIILINEQVTGPAAREMVRLAGIQESSIVLDNATGGGVCAIAAKAKYAADIDESMLEFAKSRGLDTIKADQANVPLESNTFTHVTSSFGIIFSPQDAAVLKETHRLLKSDGVAGFTSWKRIGWWPEVASAMPLPLPNPEFPAKWNDADIIREKMIAAGFKSTVQEYTYDLSIDVKSFAKATSVLVSAIARRAWSAEDFAKYGPEIEARILKYMQEKGDKYNGSVTALITIGTKTH